MKLKPRSLLASTLNQSFLHNYLKPLQIRVLLGIGGLSILLNACSSAPVQTSSSGVVPVQTEEERQAEHRQRIQMVIKRGVGELDECYQQALKQSPNQEGKIVASWTVLETGRVGTVEALESTLQNRDLEICILKRIQLWSFPPPLAPSRQYNVSYPFNLRKVVQD